MDEQKDRLTGKQRSWLERYLCSLNATESARGVYDTDDYGTLRRIGSQNLGVPYMREEINTRLRASLPSGEAVIAKLADIAFSDPMLYLSAKGELDVERHVTDERTYLVKGVRPTRDGRLAWEFEDRMVAIRMLARYYRLLGTDVTVHLEQQDTPTLDVLAALTAQVAALEEQDTAERAAAAAEQDDAND